MIGFCLILQYTPTSLLLWNQNAHLLDAHTGYIQFFSFSMKYLDKTF
jgi:hypothetical protein